MDHPCRDTIAIEKPLLESKGMQSSHAALIINDSDASSIRGRQELPVALFVVANIALSFMEYLKHPLC